MIRFPPTSIALSESDVEFHLREIQIKEQLYAQGFTREEVQRYYNERHGNTQDDVLSTRTPSSAWTNAREDAAQVAKAHTMTGETRKPSATTSIRTVSSNENSKSRQTPSSTVPHPLSSSPVSVPSSPPSVTQSSVPFRHAAVRQSSLLRIMHTAGSQSSTDSDSSRHDNDLQDHGDELSKSEAAPDDFLRATKARSYRPRSKTYTYIESEADPPTPPSHSNYAQGSSPPFLQLLHQSDSLKSAASEQSAQQRHPHLNTQSSPSWLDPEASSPLTLPPPLSIHRRTSSMQISLPDRTRSSTPLTANQHDVPHRSSPLLPSISPIILDSLDTIIIDHSPTAPSLSPTSPDRPFTSPSEEAASAMPANFASSPPRADTYPHLSSSFLDSPETPVRAPPKTEPRNPSRRPNGTFGVYNDLLPAETQPRTPADLQSPRRRAVAERNVAYTAPPGQIRTAGRLVGADSDGGEQVGAQSPTVRTTVRMRERRAREFARWRSARMGSLRGSVARGIDDEDAEGDAAVDLDMDGAITPEFTGRRLRFDGEDAEAERTERRLIREWAQFSRSRRQRDVDWRDEFDEHRVGEENFGTMDLVERRRDGGRRTRTISEEEEEEPGIVEFAVMRTTPEL